MTALTLPAAPKIVASNFQLVNTQAFNPKRDGSQQVVDLAEPYWTCDISTTPLSREQGGQYKYRFARLGSNGTIFLYDPSCPRPLAYLEGGSWGDPKVQSVDHAASTISLSGFAPGAVISPGDMGCFDDYSNTIVKGFGFDSTNEGWNGSASSFVESGIYTRNTVRRLSGGVYPDYFLSPAAAPNLLGSLIPIVKARFRIAVASGLGWNGILEYSTAGHGFSSSYYAVAAQPSGFTSGPAFEIQWDMRQLTAGGADWVNNTITRVRLNLVNKPDDWSLDYVTFGTARQPTRRLFITGGGVADGSGNLTLQVEPRPPILASGHPIVPFTMEKPSAEMVLRDKSVSFSAPILQRAQLKAVQVFRR